MNSQTDDICYSPGALIPGFTMSVINDVTPDFVVITPNFFGVTNVAVGPNTFLADTEVTFTPQVTGVGMNLISIPQASTVDVNIYGQGNVLLATVTLDLEAINGTFLGIRSSSPIERIVVVGDGSNNTEIFYELLFGQCFESDVPTLSEWGLIIMAGLLGIIGFMVIRRRKVTA